MKKYLINSLVLIALLTFCNSSLYSQAVVYTKYSIYTAIFIQEKDDIIKLTMPDYSEKEFYKHQCEKIETVDLIITKKDSTILVGKIDKMFTDSVYFSTLQDYYKLAKKDIKSFNFDTTNLESSALLGIGLNTKGPVVLFFRKMVNNFGFMIYGGYIPAVASGYGGFGIDVIGNITQSHSADLGCYFGIGSRKVDSESNFFASLGMTAKAYCFTLKLGYSFDTSQTASSSTKDMPWNRSAIFDFHFGVGLGI